MIRLAQTMHLSCIKTNTISKEKEVKFQMTHVTYEFNRVRLKWFLSLWLVRRKPCTCLASRYALSPNEPKWAITLTSAPRSTIGCVQNDFLSRWYLWRKLCIYLASKQTLSPKRKKWNSKWPMSPRSSIGCVWNDFWAFGMFDANHAPVLHQDTHYLQMNRNELSLWPRHRGVPTGASKMISKPLVRLGKLCTYLAPKLTLSPNGSWDSTWPVSPRSSIGCVQKDVRAYGTYYANRASILRQD
jgi:hypothetical protein